MEPVDRVHRDRFCERTFARRVGFDKVASFDESSCHCAIALVLAGTETWPLMDGSKCEVAG